MVVVVLFTKNAGDPATAEALADIDIFLSRRNRVTGVVGVVWAGVNPTEEIGGGLYSRTYDEDAITYDYFAWGHYTGATVMDSDYSLMSNPEGVNFDEDVESTLTVRHLLRILLAALAGESTGGGTHTPAFRDVANVKDRISAITDASGNRTAVVLDGT